MEAKNITICELGTLARSKYTNRGFVFAIPTVNVDLSG